MINEGKNFLEYKLDFESDFDSFFEVVGYFLFVFLMLNFDDIFLFYGLLESDILEICL